MFKNGTKKALCIFTLFNKQTVRKSSPIDLQKKKKICFFLIEHDRWETNQALGLLYIYFYLGKYI